MASRNYFRYRNEHAMNPNLTGEEVLATMTAEPMENPVTYADVVRGKSRE